MAKIINIIPNNVRSNLVSTLQFEVEKLDYSKIKADKNNKSAQSGETMYLDLKRMHNTLIINGRKMIDDNQEEKESLIDKAMKEVKEPEDNSGSYRPYLKKVFERIFQYAGAKIPNESIIEELITNCNQAGYQAVLCTPDMWSKLKKYNLIPSYHNYVIHINCNEYNCVDIKICFEISIGQLEGGNPKLNEDNKMDAIGSLPAALEFKLESQGDEVKYTDNKISVTLSEKLMQDKNLLIKIIEWFKELFGIEIKEPVKGPVVIEHSFDNAGVDKPKTEIKRVTVEPHQAHRVGG